MPDLVMLYVRLIATVAKLRLPGGARSIVAESLLLKHQLLILAGVLDGPGGRGQKCYA